MNNETRIDKPRILIQDKTMDMPSYNHVQTAVFLAFRQVHVCIKPSVDSLHIQGLLHLIHRHGCGSCNFQPPMFQDERTQFDGLT